MNRIVSSFVGGALFLLAAPSFGATIAVNVSGGSQTGKCNLTDAVQAAVTNAAVKGCTAGSSSSTDTIQLAGNTTYQNYGKVIHVPDTGGTLIIKGTITNGEYNTNIRAKDYGYPSPNPLAATAVCPYPAAIFSGGSNLTLQDLNVQSATGNNITGICQYKGSLTLDDVIVGDPGITYAFLRGGVRSYPNTAGTNNNQRTLKLIDTWLYGNTTLESGAGLAAFGYVNITWTRGGAFDNLAAWDGGALFWTGHWGKMGSLTVAGAHIVSNQAESNTGGGFSLQGDDTNAAVSIKSNGSGENTVISTFQLNNAGGEGGGIYVGGNTKVDQVVLSDAFIYNNYSDQGPAYYSLNPSSYDAVRCVAGSEIYDVDASGPFEWTHSPPLKGDGTCTFP